MPDATAARAALKEIADVCEDYDLEEEIAAVEAYFDYTSPHTKVFDPTALSGYGEKISRRDANGKRLRIGDKVQVVNSCTYGNPVAFVTAEATGRKSNGPTRVRVVIAEGRGKGSEYVPSIYRVTRIEKAVASDD